MGRLRKVVGWVLVIYGIVGTLDRLGYFPTAWFSNPITKVVDFFSGNPILKLLYLVFPLIMLVLGSIILLLERIHYKMRRN
jgi:ABC-type amino acid transport system permease subunit